MCHLYHSVTVMLLKSSPSQQHRLLQSSNMQTCCFTPLLYFKLINSLHLIKIIYWILFIQPLFVIPTRQVGSLKVFVPLLETDLP